MTHYQIFEIGGPGSADPKTPATLCSFHVFAVNSGSYHREGAKYAKGINVRSPVHPVRSVPFGCLAGHHGVCYLTLPKTKLVWNHNGWSSRSQQLENTLSP